MSIMKVLEVVQDTLVAEEVCDEAIVRSVVYDAADLIVIWSNMECNSI